MSSKLNCSAQGCIHNVNGLCSANNIHVEGLNAHTSNDTECDSFVKRGFLNAVTNMTNMNVKGEIKQLFNRDSIEMSPHIKCDAVSCVHNTDRVCTADNVEIYGPGASASDSTECETFKE